MAEQIAEQTDNPFVDEIILKELNKIKKRVMTKDRDYVAVYDGEEGVGKSVLAMQHAKVLDPNFNLDNVVFNAESFIKKIKDPDTKKGSCIVLDEAFNAANSRASLTEVNRAMVALATEMRQKNLFVLLVLPSFFDLDRYFALWRCRALFHVYFTPEEDRRYVTFDKESKKLLYLHGKKTYSYTYPKAPFPPCNFYNHYVVPEKEYRERKAEAFRKRSVSFRARVWMEQRNSLIRYLYKTYALTYENISQILINNGAAPLEAAQFSEIMNQEYQEGGSFSRFRH